MWLRLLLNPHPSRAREAISRLINRVGAAILAERAEPRRADKGATTSAKACPRAASTPPSRRSFARQSGVRLPDGRAKPNAQAHPKPRGRGHERTWAFGQTNDRTWSMDAYLNRLQRQPHFLSADLRRKGWRGASRGVGVPARNNKRQTKRAEGGRPPTIAEIEAPSAPNWAAQNLHRSRAPSLSGCNERRASAQLT